MKKAFKFILRGSHKELGMLNYSFTVFFEADDTSHTEYEQIIKQNYLECWKHMWKKINPDLKAILENSDWVIRVACELKEVPITNGLSHFRIDNEWYHLVTMKEFIEILN